MQYHRERKKLYRAYRASFGQEATRSGMSGRGEDDGDTHFSMLKRNRKANFTPKEINALEKVYSEYKDVLFGRLSPNVTPMERESAWLEVLKAVNRVSVCGRTLQEIKIKWKQLKQVRRTKYSLPEKQQSGKETPAASTSSSSLLKLNNPSGMKSTKLQPIAPKPSPQTIKITRAAAMQQQLPPPPPPPPEQEKEPDEVCLRWNSHHTNMKSSFPSLLEREQYVDVTLCCEGKTIRCHKLILSSCSSYFDEILSTITPFQHPVIFLKGTPFWILKSLIDFMYVGEVHIEQSKLQEILEVAEILKIKGLTGKKPQQNGEKKDDRASSNESSLQSTSIPIPVSIPTPIMPMKVLKAMPPLRLAVNKDVDPLSLLKPTFFEEPTTLRKILPKTELSRKQSLAAERSKVDVIPPRRILPKRRLKRKSSEPEEREASPPPLVLRKGTKSRPVVKAPKYYHMEYDDPNDKLMKLEDEPRESEHHFDIVNVKSEPIDEDFDIVENEVAFGQLSTTQDNITEDSEAHDKDEEPSDQHKDDSDAPMEATQETPNDASFEAENSKEDDPDYCEDECNGKEVDDTSELVAPDPEKDKDGND
ncbi:PREDICTED: protein jim lovell-like isoform X2 [Nicrophorus vespilloides]|uniref:Regulatory protein zeste n=1 Tax=Nicrophorus vespilloides TaxID=110193 RepID=A0ABM1MIJ4_NICVS|nr:PREDICTED: protein jim lovell-like isoform X2 [Nicrophorus vespilloides]